LSRAGDAFVWAFRDPEWLSKVALMGLTFLIPIIGAINGLGWMLETIDRLRAGDERLPPANLDYIGRGFNLFVVDLVYYLALAVVALVFYIPAIAVLSAEGQGQPNAALVVLGLLLLAGAVGVVTLGGLALAFAMPAIVLAVDRGGISAGLQPRAIIARAQRSPLNTLIAGLMLIAAGLLGQLGSVVCLVGVVFTSAYALTVQAWIIRSYEEE